MTRRKREPVLTRQESFDFRPRTHGGARPGAGRPRKTDKERGFIAHHARATHRKGDPVHVTLRVVRGIPALRQQVTARLVKMALVAQRHAPRTPEAQGFQVVHFTIQDDHLHLIVEAPDKRALARGVAGLEVRIARAINKLLGRKGRFWNERYHRRDLRSRADVRTVIRYVLLNSRKHHPVLGDRNFADPHSSAPSFDGFARPPAIFVDPDDPLWPTVQPATWLLRTGWKELGLIDPADLPASSPHRRSEGARAGYGARAVTSICAW